MKFSIRITLIHTLIPYEMEEFMKKLKVVTVFGTRPEIIRLSRVMAKLDQYCDHITIL